MTKLSKLLLLSMALVFVLSACGGSQNDKPGEAIEDQDGTTQEEDKSIVLALEPYDYVQPPTYLAKQILEDQGFDVKLEKGQTGMLWAALAEGEIDALLDIWEPNVSGSYIEQYEGEYAYAGTLYSDTPIGAVVPTYMDDIESIDQLNDMKETFDGTLYSIEKGTGTDATTREMVDAYDLDYEVVNSSESAMVAQAQKLMAQEEPVLFVGWRPHVMFRKLDIKLLDDPKNVWASDDCRTGVALDLEERAPQAYTLFMNMEMPIEEIEEWLFKMEDGATPEELAKEWVEDNADTVEDWLSGSSQ